MTDTALVLEKKEAVGESRKISLSQVKVLEKSNETRIKITTIDGVVTEIIINELVKGDIERFVFLYKFMSEGQEITNIIERTLHNYVLLLSPIFRVMTVLTKGNVPEWNFLAETMSRLREFVESVDLPTGSADVRKNIIDYVKALSTSVDRRNVSTLLSAARNYVKYITTHFSDSLKRMLIYVDFSHMIDLTLTTFIYFYSKNLGLPLQAERAHNEFKHLVQELISGIHISDEAFKDRVVTSFELVLGSSGSPEEASQMFLSVLREEIIRYILRST
ncbi:MAG: hypothetical protein QXX81_02880 [Zestosphaera sp.]